MAMLSAGELHSGCEGRLTRTWSRVLLRPARLWVARERGSEGSRLHCFGSPARGAPVVKHRSALRGASLVVSCA